MNYSIPLGHRNTPAIPDELYPVKSPESGPNLKEEDEEDGNLGTERTGRSFELNKCQITPPKEETEIMKEVKEVVTVMEHDEEACVFF